MARKYCKLKAKEIRGQVLIVYSLKARRAGYRGGWVEFIADLQLMDELAVEAMMVLKDIIEDENNKNTIR